MLNINLTVVICLECPVLLLTPFASNNLAEVLLIYKDEMLPVHRLEALRLEAGMPGEWVVVVGC